MSNLVINGMSNNFFFGRGRKPGNFINNGMSNKLNCVDGQATSQESTFNRNENNYTINIDGASFKGDPANIMSLIDSVIPGLLSGINLNGANFGGFEEREYYEEDSINSFSEESGSEVYEEEDEEIDEEEFLQVKKQLIDNLRKEEFAKYLKKNKQIHE